MDDEWWLTMMDDNDRHYESHAQLLLLVFNCSTVFCFRCCLWFQGFSSDQLISLFPSLVSLCLTGGRGSSGHLPSSWSVNHDHDDRPFIIDPNKSSSLATSHWRSTISPWSPWWSSVVRFTNCFARWADPAASCASAARRKRQLWQDFGYMKPIS